MHLKALNVTKEYVSAAERVCALRSVSLEVAPGELVVLMGTSGSGKTTLINLLAGLHVPDSGEVAVGDTVLSEMAESARADFRLRHLGLVFQDHNLISELTALENVSLPLIAMGLPREHAQEKAQAALGLVQIPSLGDRLPSEMSGGQRQRVGIARAVAKDSRVVLADEPTGSLDRRTSTGIFETMADLCSSGATIVVASHDPIAEKFASRTLRMRDGEVLAGAA